MNLNKYLDIKPEVAEALAAGKPVVALESTITTTFYEKAPKTCDPGQMIKDGQLDRGAVYAAVRRILRLMDRLE